MLSKNIDPNKIFIVNRSEIEGRWDPSIYKKVFRFISNVYSECKLLDIAFINPNTPFDKLDSDSEISFIPMDAIDELNGIVSKVYFRKVSESKGYTRFKENDLIWAKITPCMQNGNSAIVRNTRQGFAFGSTEFFVIRPKSSNVIIEYIYILLRDRRILDSAMNYFGGSAGQQRIPKEFLANFRLPLPPLPIQQQIVTLYQNAYTQKQQKETQAATLLASIDDYLLGELGITLPEQDKSLRSRIFTTQFREVEGRLDPDYYRLKYKMKNNAISKGLYGKKSLKEITIILSSGKTPSSKEYSEIPNEYPIIKVGSYIKNFIDLNKTGFTLAPQTLIAKKNDIFILSAAHQSEYVGRHIKFLDEEPKHPTSYVGELICVRCSQECNPMYLFSILNTSIFKDLINREKTGQTSHVYGKDLKHIFIPLPPLEKQTEIAEHIKGIHTQAKKLQKEAQQILEKAKREVEQMILGE